MYKLFEFLQGKDGGAKTERDATKNATDVSKYLRYCGSKLNWDHLDCKKMEQFLCKVREAGCGPDTEKKFVLAFHHGLNFIKLCQMNSSDHQRLAQVTVVQERLARWRSTLQKATGEARQRQLEESSLNAKEDLSKVEDLITCEEFWQDYNRAVQDAKIMKRLANATLARLTTALAVVLLFKNMHRSGVAANATLLYKSTIPPPSLMTTE